MKSLVIILVTILLIAALAAGWWIRQDMHATLGQPMPLEQDSILLIRPGQSLKSLAAELVSRGWIAHPYYFIYEGRRQGKASALKIGEYTVPVNTTPLELLELVVAGKVRQYSLTLPEGWTFRQIMEEIRSSKHLRHTLNSYKPRYVMAEAGFSGYRAEGRIFPDTYHFPAGTTDVEFIRRAIRMQEKVLLEEWEEREEGLPYQSSYEALIMASIIERETGVAEERQRIAGVFVRRLRANMKLQTDPTVIYAMAESFDGDIRRKDLAIDSPYNTYLYRGLPPTPIASPGKQAIHAALHPASGKELYFVARGDGSHHFSETLREHNRAVAKYQLNR